MDVDTSYQEFSVSQEFSSPVPVSVAPTITNFNALFHESQSPVRPAPSPSAPALGKRRSLFPESVSRSNSGLSSSPATPSSPSEHKFERIVSGPLPSSRSSKPVLEGLGIANPSKRLRRPVFSDVGPMSAISSSQPEHLSSSKEKKQIFTMPPQRRAFSAMLPPNTLNVPDSPSDDSYSLELPDTSPAQAYMKRQQSKTLRRCDGSDNLRPMLRETHAKECGPRQALNENSPNTARWMMPGFGDNEAHGKILPCHRVKEDGLMRVMTKTVGLFIQHLNMTANKRSG
jgi:M-phase inducer tyrosine phosphatase